MGARWGQLFMMLAPIAASFAAWILLGETLRLQIIVGIIITITGISMSVVCKPHHGHTRNANSAENGSNSDIEKSVSNIDTKNTHLPLLKVPLKGVLFGIGAGVGQGVGLVLSKVGMEHYALSIPEEATTEAFLMPFASTMIRACAGLVGLSILLVMKGEGRKFLPSLRDGKSMLLTLVATITGPYVGVSLSLMALLYTSAGVAQTLMALTPILILWPSHVIFHQKVTLVEIIGALVSVVGVSLFFI